MSGDNHLACCSAVPFRERLRARLLWTTNENADAMHADANASTASAIAGIARPRPPSASGTVSPQSPRAAASRNASAGTRPASSHATAFGSMTSRANARAASTTAASRSGTGAITASSPFTASRPVNRPTHNRQERTHKKVSGRDASPTRGRSSP